MNRPMTSPWLAVMTSSPTITLMPYWAAFSRASRAPEISLWSVTAIAPRPTSRAVASSTSTGVAQSLEWSVCMCRSTSISLRLASRARTSGLRVRLVAQRGQALVDRLDVVGDLAPGELPAGVGAARARAARAAPSSRTIRSSCSASTPDVAELEVQPEVALAQHLLVDRHARRERDGAGAERLHEHAGRGDLAERGGDDHVGAGQRGVLVVDDLDAVAQARAQRRHRAGLRVDDGLPRQLLGQLAQRAQEQPQRAALLAVGEGDPHRRARGPLGRGPRSSRRAAAARSRRGRSATAARRWPRS